MENNEQVDTGESSPSSLTSTIGATNTTPIVIADTVPSSSSDANTGEAEEATESKPTEETISSTSDEIDRVSSQVDATSATVTDKEDKMDIDNEADMFANDLNLSTTSAVKITENVEDIVSDLENLLGNPVGDYKASTAAETSLSKESDCVENCELNFDNLPKITDISLVGEKTVGSESVLGTKEIEFLNDVLENPIKSIEERDSDSTSVLEKKADETSISDSSMAIDNQEQNVESEPMEQMAADEEIKENVAVVETTEIHADVSGEKNIHKGGKIDDVHKVDSSSEEFEQVDSEQALEQEGKKEVDKMEVDQSTEKAFKSSEVENWETTKMECCKIRKQVNSVQPEPVDFGKSEFADSIQPEPVELKSVASDRPKSIVSDHPESVKSVQPEDSDQPKPVDSDQPEPIDPDQLARVDSIQPQPVSVLSESVESVQPISVESVQPDSRISVQSEPVESIQTEPVKSVQPKSVQSIQSEPVESVQSELSDSVHPVLSGSVQCEQVESVQPAPVDNVHSKPVESVLPEPVESVPPEPTDSEQPEQVETIQTEQIESLQTEQVEPVLLEPVAVQTRPSDLDRSEQIESVKSEPFVSVPSEQGESVHQGFVDAGNLEQVDTDNPEKVASSEDMDTCDAPNKDEKVEISLEAHQSLAIAEKDQIGEPMETNEVKTEVQLSKGCSFATEHEVIEQKVSEVVESEPQTTELEKVDDEPIPVVVLKAPSPNQGTPSTEKETVDTESPHTPVSPTETTKDADSTVDTVTVINTSEVEKQIDEPPMVITGILSDTEPEEGDKSAKEVVETPEVSCNESETNDEHNGEDEDTIEPQSRKVDEPEIDHEAELVRAAIEASAFGQYAKEEERPQDVQKPAISDDDVIRAAMDCTARDCNEEEDLIKAAQECQDREIHVHEEEQTVETRRVELQVSSTTFVEVIPSVAVEEKGEVKSIATTEVEEKVVIKESEPDVQFVQDYQKPLNIVVDSSLKEAQSSTQQEDSNKESSDEDKDKEKEEYFSKISQNQELKLTIRKTKAEETSILKIYNPMDEVIEISPSESETDQESESPIPKLVIKQSQVSPKRKTDLSSPYKITIKQVPAKQEDVINERSTQKSSPKLIIKPIVKPDEDLHHSPKITIKPIPKPEELERCNSPKITIKPLIKPEACISPKIKIKPILKPEEEMHATSHPYEEDRIVLKISKRERDATPKRDSTPKRESSRCLTPKLEEKDEKEKLGKIKMKFSMSGGGHAHIVNENDSDVAEVEAKRSKLTDPSYNDSSSVDSSFITSPDVIPVDKPITPTPKRRGRPRKVPLQVRVEDEEPVVVETAMDVDESSAGTGEEVSEAEPKRLGRPKRSCRGPSNVRDTLGLKPLGEPRGRGGRGSRRARGRGAGRGRGRGGRGRGRGARAAEAFEREEVAETTLKLKEAVNSSFEDVDDVEMKVEDTPQEDRASIVEQDDDSDVMIYEEDTRMSADDLPTSPAKQVVNPIVGELIDESQSSVLSTGTTESAKLKKNKMEIEPEGAVISAEQLAEYYWGGGGPYMLQEQVAQFLGIKSFKRKYPGIPRRQVDMQERDFIRESGLASEHMCDLGLTVVNSADILDLMYSDFQHKYEEYCKHQRDRQTKDITNKQKALSLAASQEKNKMDIMQQAVESAAQWNASFNKQRREDRKACMDLQTFTINYPKGRMKKIDRGKIGHYPLALVPGQYTDYYKTYTPTELNNLPLNTMLYNPINIPEDESQSSGSESESSSSSSGSSDSDSSEDDCNMCSSPPPAPANRRVYS